jgi:predicted dehydrogenase
VSHPSKDRSEALRAEFGPELGAEFGSEFLTGDYRDLLSRDDVDIVCICSPNRLHARQILDALAAGKHVLCEKPMVTSIEDARQVVAASQATDTRLLVGQVCRFSPVFQAIKQRYDDGDLGEAFFAEADYIKQSLHIHKRWWLDAQEPHFSVFNGGVHPLDLLRWVVGEVAEVQAYGNDLAVPEATFEDCVIATLRFTSGCIGKLLVAYGAWMPYELNLGIYGTRGTMRNDRLFLATAADEEDFTRLPITIVREHPHFRQEWDELVEAIEEGRPTRVDALDGARTVALCVAVSQALDSGRPVAVTQRF